MFALSIPTTWWMRGFLCSDAPVHLVYRCSVCISREAPHVASTMWRRPTIRFQKSGIGLRSMRRSSWWPRGWRLFVFCPYLTEPISSESFCSWNWRWVSEPTSPSRLSMPHPIKFRRCGRHCYWRMETIIAKKNARLNTTHLPQTYKAVRLHLSPVTTLGQERWWGRARTFLKLMVVSGLLFSTVFRTSSFVACQTGNLDRVIGYVTHYQTG